MGGFERGHTSSVDVTEASRPPGIVIVTVDHEVFGNGSGSPENCMRRPLRRMLRAMTNRGAPLTIFLEPLELAVRQRSGERGRAEVSAVIAQVSEAIVGGHDLQLHLHPQWWPAISNGGVSPDLSAWRVGDHSEQQLDELLRFGVAWIEEHLPGMRNRLVAFRAGGWCIQPGEAIYSALPSVGIRVDSSVAPGLVSSVAPGWYDFRDVPDSPWWTVERGGGVVEVPICTGRLRLAGYLRRLGELHLTGAGKLPSGCVGEYAGRSSLGARMKRVRDLMRAPGRAMLDFCCLSGVQMIRLAASYVDRFAEGPAPLPVVAIGHSKSFGVEAERSLQLFLDWVREQPSLRFGTFGDWIRARQRRE